MKTLENLILAVDFEFLTKSPAIATTEIKRWIDLAFFIQVPISYLFPIFLFKFSIAGSTNLSSRCHCLFYCAQAVRSNLPIH
ncbi:hypothetical protein QN277_011870 [Acacia crassicarpa]|uniref:Uncharacterized protein n=1 Tax=Acacia crassicarpa TaxID=499986 RepID=A0AAE1MZR2_9FABA|nr:hypothetical protein QN277_011870 [Acacia crassicarpa]